MRAYTSLIGHIFGSHNEIDGYYELHAGYFSWKSLIRVKFLYYKDHNTTSTASFLFDKVLHNEHYVSDEILRRKDITPIFSLRDPESTIHSIISHYKKVNTEHEYTNIEFATNYYIERVSSLVSLANKLNGKYLYIDAACIKDDADNSLAIISDYLGLKEQLTPQYKKMKKTGKRYSGDSSEELLSGKIQRKVKSNNNIEIPQELLSKAIEAFVQSRDFLILNAEINIQMGKQ